MNTMAAPSTTTATQDDERTPAQVRQLENILRDALAKKIEERNPNRAALQQAIDRASELTGSLNEKLDELLEVETFSDEEEGFDAQYDYPPGFAANPISDQIALIWQHFPGRYPNQELLAKVKAGTAPLPPGADGWYAILNPRVVAPTYNEAVEKIIEILGSTRALENYVKGELGTNKLRQHARTAHALDLISEAQGNPDILLVPAQFGKRHAGRSVRRARYVFESKEFGLGAFGVANMLLTHPKRLVHYDNLWIDCPGDEYDYDADGKWSGAPLFGFGDGRLEFDTRWADGAHSVYGSVSGFVPQ